MKLIILSPPLIEVVLIHVLCISVVIPHVQFSGGQDTSRGILRGTPPADPEQPEPSTIYILIPYVCIAYRKIFQRWV